MKYLELSPGWDEVYVFAPGWNELDLYFHRAGMDFTGTSPGCYETRKVNRAGMDFTGTSPGCCELSGTFTGLE
jgi:hypothetical protein